MSRTLDGSPTDPETSYETQARALLADATAERRTLGALLRERGIGMVAAGQTLDRPRRPLDPQPVPFEALEFGDHILIEDEWHQVLEKATRTDEEGQHRELVVTRVEGFRIKRTVEVEDGATVTRGAF